MTTPKDSVKQSLKTFKLVCYVSVFIAGSLLNVLLLLAVTRKRLRHRNSSKIFIHLVRNLAVADILLLVFTIPFDAAWHQADEFPYGPAMCKILWPLQTAIFQAVVFTYVMLSFHRTYGVTRSLFGQMRAAVSYLLIALIWITSFLIVTPYMVYLKHSPRSNESRRASCDEQWESMDHRRGYTVVLFLTQYFIPLMVMYALYFLTNRALDVYMSSCSSRQLRSLTRRAERHHRVNVMLVLYLISFAVLLLPHQIMYFLLDFSTHHQQWPYFEDVLHLLYVLTYAITITNPLLFFKYNHEFRSDAWFFLRFGRARRDDGLVEESSESFSEGDDATRATLVDREPYHGNNDMELEINDNVPDWNNTEVNRTNRERRVKLDTQV